MDAEQRPHVTTSLPVEAFEHPLDAGALSAMQTWLASKPRVNEWIERLQARTLAEARVANLADNTRIGEDQFGGLHAIVADAARRLRTPAPEVFVDTQPDLNAFALGDAKGSSIVFNTALLDAFDHDEIAVVAGHELGHVVARHSFYRLLQQRFDVVVALVAAVPGGSLLSLVFERLLRDWGKKAELTADRAGLLATDDLEAVQRVILKLAGGTTRAGLGEINVTAFLEQAREYRSILVQHAQEAGMKDKVETAASDLIAASGSGTHPWPALRFLEITEWAESAQYEALRAGDIDAAVAHGRSVRLETRSTMSTVAPTASSAAADLGKSAAEAAKGWLSRRRE